MKARELANCNHHYSYTVLDVGLDSDLNGFISFVPRILPAFQYSEGYNYCRLSSDLKVALVLGQNDQLPFPFKPVAGCESN